MKQASDGSVFAIALFFGLGFIYLSCGDRAVLRCDRAQDSCQLVEKNFWRSVSKDFPISDLKTVEEIIPGGDALPYVHLYTSRGEIYLESWANFSINEIKTFANNPAQRFLNIKTYPWGDWWTGGILTGFSSLVFLSFFIYEVKSLIYGLNK
ncbi:hypothetical protein NIES2100_43320 [Calothrix sp. NIES-2100]|uniref:hypothetical protein n=1 Tax=Calothrix sp. NIES-2100 TaxID=1954172 RepID=UPI000B61531F|nr:hypothetical protein NIES2100_43320 [Calothrix sp. NIES-2100]